LGEPLSREVALRELLRGRLGITGPTTAAAHAAAIAVPETEAFGALVALEAEGVVLRGHFTARRERDTLEWCDRSLLARIHRYTLNRLRAEIEPVSAADFMRFLFVWQRIDPDQNVAGLAGLASVIEQLDGFEVPAGAWEADVLSSRCAEYDPALLDTLCLTGRVAWGRTSGRSGSSENGSTPGARAAGPIRTTPVALFLRETAQYWLPGGDALDHAGLSEYGRRVREVLARRGASFFHELVSGSGLLATQAEQALGELAALGLVTSDGFAGLRALITPSAKRKPLLTAARRHRTVPFGIESAGRWALLEGQTGLVSDHERVEHKARTLLGRYGVICRRLLEREANAPLWRDLLMVYRRLEARGEIRGGRFIAGLAGEQFALPGAVAQLRAIRRLGGHGRLIGLSAADPLNLTGIVTPGERVPALTTNRILYEDGVPVLARVAGETRVLDATAEERMTKLAPALIRRGISPALRMQLALSGVPAAGATLERPPKRRPRRGATPTPSGSVSEEIPASSESR
jgi:ATP-dependent Lhr-like helicase